MSMRERSFFIMGTRAEDVLQGHETFFLCFEGLYENIKSSFYGGTKLFRMKIFWMKSLMKD